MTDRMHDIDDNQPFLFLDIDGVLNDCQYNTTSESFTIKPECVKQFNRIIEATDPNVVISSAWRSMIAFGALTLTGFSHLLRSHGVSFYTRIVGHTPLEDLVAKREDQIIVWLRKKKLTSVIWVAVDDSPLRFPRMDCFVQTRSKEGLTEGKAAEVVCRLKGLEYPCYPCYSIWL